MALSWQISARQGRVASSRLSHFEANLADPMMRLILLDELNIALRYDYLPLDDILTTLAARRADLHVVVTGRNAKPDLIAAADLVTEMTLVRHHHQQGVPAQRGIED